MTTQMEQDVHPGEARWESRRSKTGIQAEQDEHPDGARWAFRRSKMGILTEQGGHPDGARWASRRSKTGTEPKQDGHPAEAGWVSPYGPRCEVALRNALVFEAVLRNRGLPDTCAFHGSHLSRLRYGFDSSNAQDASEGLRSETSKTGA